jgi:hypothetical protein
MPEPISPKNSHQFNRANVILILILLSAGCREILPYRTTAPEISGVLLQNGTPLADIVVSSCVSGNSAKRCARFMKTTTDSQGKFYFDSANEFISRVSQVGSSSFNYNINFQYLGQDYRWSENGEELPDNVNLRCDISHQALCTVHSFNP